MSSGTRGGWTGKTVPEWAPGTRARVFPRLLAMLLLAVLLSPAAARAQGWTLIGFVRDDVGRPVQGAQILIGSLDTRTTTDSEGRFALRGIPLGLTYVAARRVGYLPSVDLIRLTPTDTLSFMLEEIGQRADTVRVRSRAEAVWESDVRRFAWATDLARSGTVLTDREIAERAPTYTTDLFRGRSGFNVLGEGNLARVVNNRGRCRPNIFIDGQELPGYNVNDIVPASIKLLITYPSFAALPQAFVTLRGNPGCGVIAIISL